MNDDRLHWVTAEWDPVAGTWLHTCTVCGQQTRRHAPALPCPGPPEEEGR